MMWPGHPFSYPQKQQHVTEGFAAIRVRELRRQERGRSANALIGMFVDFVRLAGQEFDPWTAGPLRRAGNLQPNP